MEEFMTPVQESASQMAELINTFVGAGFSRGEAMQILLSDLSATRFGQAFRGSA